MGLNIFKLEKLKIESFSDVKRSDNPTMKFEAMFNPTEMHWSYEIKLTNARATNAPHPAQTYAYSEPSQLSFKLVLDGTGVERTSAEFWEKPRQTVAARIKDFKKVTLDYDGNAHEPPHLRLSWGVSEQFDCRLCKVDIKYTMFDRDGSPLRAELEIMLHADPDPEKSAKKAGKQSPDMTHARVVRAGDTLPLLTASIYGSPDKYLDVARYNELDDFRTLQLGQTLLFPPIGVFDNKSSMGGASS